MICSSWAWPNMFNVSRSQVNLYNDTRSITNRVKLLLLTEPTELYMNPTFGVGLKRYLYTYNNDNTIALIRDRLVEQLTLWEPSVIPEETQIVRGNLYSRDPSDPISVSERMNELNLSITLVTIYRETVSFDLTQSDVSKFI